MITMTVLPSRRWPWLRSLRSVASMGCFSLCVALCLLWVRSYFWSDVISKRAPDRTWKVMSWDGKIEYCNMPMDVARPDHPVVFSSHTTDMYRQMDALVAKVGSLMSVDSIRTVMPHWCFALVAAIAAIGLKPSPRYRFSLLDFLALTTFVAALAGSVAWLVRLKS